MPTIGDSTRSPLVADIVQLTDYDEIREVLRSPHFVQAGYASAEHDLMHECLTMLDGPRHLQRRRMMGHLFSEQALEAYRREHLAPVIDRSLAEIADGRDFDGVVRADLVPLMWRMLHRIAAAITGIDGVDTPAAVERLIAQIRAIGASITVDWNLGDHGAVVEAGRTALAEFNDVFFLPSWRRREELVARFNDGEIERTDLPLDLLTMMQVHHDETWPSDLPLRESAVFLVGATQTTSQAFGPFVVNLESWFDEHPEDRALVEDDPEFLRRAAAESLRLFVAAPARLRRATADVVLGSGRAVAADERVALLFLPANKQEQHFGPDADRYDPHRRPEGASPWGLAFGAGSHACIGRPLVTGIGSQTRNDGTMVTIARRLYAAGLILDPDNPPRFEEATYYATYAAVPICLTRL